jgi:hypothetical protein
MYCDCDVFGFKSVVDGVGVKVRGREYLTGVIKFRRAVPRPGDILKRPHSPTTAVSITSRDFKYCQKTGIAPKSLCSCNDLFL